MTPTTVTQRAACVLIVAWWSLLMVVNAEEPSKTEPSKLIFNVGVGLEPGEPGLKEWPHPGDSSWRWRRRGLSAKSRGSRSARPRQGADGPRSRHRPLEAGSHRLVECSLGDLPARQPRPATARDV